MVSTSAPSALSAKTAQLFTETPSRWMTQAPHWLVSQPTWVPVSPSVSRRNSTRRVRPSTSPVTAWPFTVMDMDGMSSENSPMTDGELKAAAP